MIKRNKNENPKAVLLMTISFLLIFAFTCNTYSQNYKIDNINFIHKDMQTIDDSELKDAVGITKSKYYYPDALSNDIISLRNFYFDNGYFEANVDKELSYNYDDSTVSINFIITSNHQYRIGQIKRTGLDNVLDSLRSIIDTMKTIQVNNFYNKAYMVKYSTGILDFLQNNGYMSATLKNDSGYILRKQDTSVFLTINFANSDTLYKFGKTEINIDSNFYDVSTEFLRKGVTYAEGEVYSKKKRLDTDKNISQMPIIRSARIRTVSINGTSVNLRIECRLSKKQELTPYAEGTNINNHFYAGGGLQYLNKYLWGGGRIFTSEIHALYSSLKVNLIEFVNQLTQPYFVNDQSSLNDKLSLGYYNFDGYSDYYLGNITSFRYYIADYTFYNKATIDLNEELLKVKYDFGNLRTINLYNSFLSITFIHDNTNNAIAPSRGFYHSITAGEGGLLPQWILNSFENNFSYSKFIKLSTSNRFYLNLSNTEGENVIATKFIIADNITRGGGPKVVPIQPIFRYFSGGSNSLRGWYANSNGFVNERRFGGNFWLDGSFEFRKKLFPGSSTFTKNIGAVVFADYGNVWETHQDFRFDQIAIAIGVGLRYNIFIGPIRVDFGFKLYDPLDADGKKWLLQNDFKTIFSKKLAVNFGIGEAF
ncbi:MAG TPA: BamA/TamA family outer membrane protein [Ignavibacteria bacterium]